jgi:hypothetical protein
MPKPVSLRPIWKSKQNDRKIFPRPEQKQSPSCTNWRILRPYLDNMSMFKNCCRNREPKMSAYDILTFMFNVVFQNMYRSEWAALFGEAVIDCDMPNEETIIEETQ